MRNVESEWCRHAVQVAHHPMAFVDATQKFVAVNSAFERLIGYSTAELEGRTWMSITHSQDVGGDLLSVDSIEKGFSEGYTTEKRYVAKNGDIVPVAITVWKYPQHSNQLTGFTVQAVPDDMMGRLDQIHASHIADIESIKIRLERNEQVYKTIFTVGEFLLKWLPLITAIVASLAWFFTRGQSVHK